MPDLPAIGHFCFYQLIPKKSKEFGTFAPIFDEEIIK